MNPILELPSDVHSTIVSILLLLIFFYIVFILLHLAQKLVNRSIGKLKVHMLKCKEYKLPDIPAIGNSERRGTSDIGISSSDHHRVMCFICDNWAAHRCKRCKVAKYCSKSCQIKHWREGHMLECEERESPANVDFASAVSSDGSGTSHMISNSDHRRDLGQVPSTSTRQHICVVCYDWAFSRCRRCKVPYCSKTCQMKDWKEGHMLECKEYKPPNSLDSVPDITSERRDSGHMDISSSGPSSNRDEIPSSSASPHICFVCSNLADTRCSSCKIVKYCSETCQLRHWKEGHKLECKQYGSPANVDSVPAVTRERRDSGHLGKSSHRKRDQMPSTSSSSHICFVCGHWAEARCSRCRVTRYCSETCQMKHWNEGHRLECNDSNEYRSPINVDSLPAVSSEQRGSGRLAISSSDYHTDRNPMPSAPASQKFCFVCGDWAAIRCGRCKVIKYCSQTCLIKHWRADHWFECKEDKSPTNLDSTSAFGSERRGSGHMGISSSEYQRSKKDGKFAETVQSSKGTTYSKELRTVEECPICFCTIHTSEPKCSLLACENCKYKFHSACLLKWFSTSKKSHCPLCQSPFKSKGAALKNKTASLR